MSVFIGHDGRVTSNASQSPGNDPHSPESIRQHAKAAVALDGAPEASAEEVERVARAIDPGVWALRDLAERLLDDWHRADLSKSKRQALAAIRAMRGVA